MKGGLKSGREDKLGHAWPQRRAINWWPHLWSTAHTCHPRWHVHPSVCLSHAHIRHLLYSHMLAHASKQSTSYQVTHTHADKETHKRAEAAAHRCRRFSVNCSCRAMLCFVELSWHSQAAAGYLFCCTPLSSSSTHSPPSPFLLCFLPVRETDVRSKLDRHQRPHHLKLLKISKRTEDAETMRRARVKISYLSTNHIS